jgi:tetratricopeptide (TPR) repeat protein
VLAGALGAPQAAQAAEPADLAEDEPGDADDEDRTDTNPQLERAMAAFRRGNVAYEAGRYEDALVAFQDAATLHASPDFQYNIGLCYEKLDKLAEAIGAFETYLRTKPDAPDRVAVEDRVAALRARQQREAAAAREAAARETPAPTSTVVDEPPRDGTRPLRIAGGVLVGFGAAMALGGGIGFGLVAKQRSDAIGEIQDGGNPRGSSFADAQALEREGKRFEALQAASIAVGAAVAITGTALVAVANKRRKQAAESAQLRVVPELGWHFAGFSLGGRF